MYSIRDRYSRSSDEQCLALRLLIACDVMRCMRKWQEPMLKAEIEKARKMDEQIRKAAVEFCSDPTRQ